MQYIFDLTIFGFLAINGFMLFVFMFGAWRKRAILRKPLFYVLFGMLLLIFGFTVYGSLIEPQIIVVTEESIDIATEKPAVEKANVKIVLVSDFHVGPYKHAGFVKRAVEKINALKPDIILLAGDYLFEHDNGTEALKPLSGLNSPVYAVWGNHDYSPETGVRHIRKVFDESGIKMLVNETFIYEKDGKKLQILGLDDLWMGKIPLQETLASLEQDLPTVILIHNPDIVLSLKKDDVDLVLAAHTHGGQVRLPFIGPVPNLPTQLGKTYDQGYFEYNGTPLFITRGLGESGPRTRLFAWPEIALISLSY